MRILVLAVGRLKDGPERELVSRYLERARRILAEEIKAFKRVADEEKAAAFRPKVFFVSRTHSQIAQFVREEIEPLDYLFPKDETYNTGNRALMQIMAPLKARVRTYASSTPTVSSAPSANVKRPENIGSILAASVSSDSPRLKLRAPGPVSPPSGMKPWMR